MRLSHACRDLWLAVVDNVCICVQRIDWLPSLVDEHGDQLIQVQRVERVVVQLDGVPHWMVEHPASKRIVKLSPVPDVLLEKLSIRSGVYSWGPRQGAFPVSNLLPSARHQS